MLRSMNDLEGDAIRATDGIIGHVKDFYFDDQAWVIRYLVVETGSWLASRKVLISPIAIGKPNWSERILPVSITKGQVKHSPDVDSEKPVSRQHEMRHLGYYGYPFYWGGAGLWGSGAYPNLMLPGYANLPLAPGAVQTETEASEARADAAHHQDDDPHLRSWHAVMSYHIEASDGDVGHVHDLLVDEETWAIRYIIVSTSNWWAGHQVVIAPPWIESVNWSEATVSVNVTRQAVKNAPSYESAAQLDREQEASIYGHYGFAGYWTTEAKQHTAISGR